MRQIKSEFKQKERTNWGEWFKHRQRNHEKLSWPGLTILFNSHCSGRKIIRLLVFLHVQYINLGSIIYLWETKKDF